MDLRAFESWLGGIDTLSEPQRRRAWQALALSEAADSQDIKMHTASGQSASSLERAVDEPRPANLLVAAPPANPLGAAGVAALGQRRVDSVGCPHCENLDVVRWGPGERSAPLSLQGLFADVQCADENAVGEPTHEGQMGHARPRL